MRVYLAATVNDLRQLQEGATLTLPCFEPVSDDELDEFAALADAADAGDVAIAADVEAPGGPIGLEHVASFHLDADGSGDLAWYATQEVGEVVALLDGSIS
ncbi:MAG TPA: hypothetical protein VM093_09180 [Aeromicrobium sp.]|nr:hypothetical protein [Aeromicrobium sp.]